MNKILAAVIVFILFILIAIIFSYQSLSHHNISNSATIDSLNITNNSSISTRPVSYIANGTNLSMDDEHLVLPSREAILNGVNWSNYPLLRNPYIHNYEISDPTDVVNHKFLYVTIVVEVSDTRNETEVLKQESGIVTELQNIIGLDSGPNVWGTADGVWVYYAYIMPYESKVHAHAYH